MGDGEGFVPRSVYSMESIQLDDGSVFVLKTSCPGCPGDGVSSEYGIWVEGLGDDGLSDGNSGGMPHNLCFPCSYCRNEDNARIRGIAESVFEKLIPPELKNGAGHGVYSVTKVCELTGTLLVKLWNVTFTSLESFQTIQTERDCMDAMGLGGWHDRL